MNTMIETPPQLTGSEETQLQQIYCYLFRLSENLNVALQEVDNTTAVQVSQQGSATGNTYNELRALIVNTADVVKKELQVIEKNANDGIDGLSRSMEAVSKQWGTFQENIQSTIKATAEAVVTSYGYDAELETLKEQAAGFSNYQIRTEGSIRQGFLDYDENGIPILGIAIGQGLLYKKVTIDGKEYEELDASQNMAFYTANKVSFRIGGQEVAYVSNRKLYIGDMEITGNVVLGRKWQLSMAKGFLIKWIGGDG